MVQEKELKESSPFTDKAFDISINVINREDLPIREKWRSTSHITELAHRFFFSFFSLVAGECLKDNYTDNIEDEFENIVDLLFRRFNSDNLSAQGSLEGSIGEYIKRLEKYHFFVPNDLVDLVEDNNDLTSLEFSSGSEGDLDSVVDCIRDVLKSLRDEKIEFWKRVFELYTEDKEAYDLEFRTKALRHKKDLDRFSKIDIKEYIDKLGSIGKKNKDS